LLTETLLAWYRRGHRDLPWRRTRDPYAIWISEIMLQQTRVQAALPYYERFMARFPTVESLAQAPEEEVLACWSGLGYYSRARNVQKAARRIVAAGSFPADLQGIRSLPGIGDYTAAAIASIAFGQPCAVLDGNVMRVIARVESDASDIASVRTRRRFQQTAQQWLDPESPGEFNQALMELGATICLPRDPQCLVCPIAAACAARDAGVQSQLPVKIRKQEPRRIHGSVAVVRKNGKVLLWRRSETASRMRGFWELPAPDQLSKFQLSATFGRIRHTITRHRYELLVVSGTVPRAPRGFRWLTPEELSRLPVSTTARKALALAAARDNHPSGASEGS
jgi:A/G-specific adenine glycosylase